MSDNANFFITLKGWQKQVQSLPDALLKDSLKGIEKDVAATIQANYSAQQDPYGNPWRARKRDYPWPILDRTGRTKGSYSVKATGKGFQVTNSSPVAGFHQRGTEKMVSRKLVPEAKKGIPPEWSDIITANLQQAFSKAFKR